MRRVTACFAILPLFLLTARLAAADTEHVTRTFQVAPGAELRLNTFSGHVRITGRDVSQITIDAVRSGSREELDNTKLDIEQHGSTVVVEANVRDRGWFSWWGHSDVVSTDFTITVPRPTNLQLHTFSSGVDVAGTTGDADVHTFSAPVRLEEVRGGTIRVHSFSGPITVRAAEAVANIDVDTFSGGVDLRVPDKAHAITDFRSFSGRLTSSLPLLLRSTSRRTTTAELDGPGPTGHIRVKTFSGNLTIDR